MYCLRFIQIMTLQGFGMSESTGPHTVNIPNSFRFDSAGVTIPGAETKIHNPDDDQQGEICLFGRNVFMGYLGDEKQTNEAIDENGWLHSGDIGKIDKEGFLYITGRIKVNNFPTIIVLCQKCNISTVFCLLGVAYNSRRRKHLSGTHWTKCKSGTSVPGPSCRNMRQEEVPLDASYSICKWYIYSCATYTNGEPCFYGRNFFRQRLTQTQANPTTNSHRS